MKVRILENMSSDAGHTSENPNVGRYYIKPEGSQITIVGASRNDRGDWYYLYHCSSCSLDQELFPDGFFKSHITYFNKKILKCGCDDSYRYTKTQNYVLSERKRLELMEVKDELGIPLYYTNPLSSKMERLAYYTDYCKDVSEKLGHEFIEIMNKPLRFALTDKVAFICKSSGKFCDTTSTSRYIRGDDCTCSPCTHERVAVKANQTKRGKNILKYGVATNDLVGTKGYRSRDCPYYLRWHDLLKRCLCKITKKKLPSYKDATICEEWLVFSNFKSWMEGEDWEGNHLDKDILIKGNKHYSPENCVFVRPEINTFLIDRRGDRGDLALGVTSCSNGKYIASVNNPFTKLNENLGRFPTEMLAHFAWKKRKHELAVLLSESVLVKDTRVRSALQTRWAEVGVLEDEHKRGV